VLNWTQNLVGSRFLKRLAVLRCPYQKMNACGRHSWIGTATIHSNCRSVPLTMWLEVARASQGHNHIFCGCNLDSRVYGRDLMSNIPKQFVQTCGLLNLPSLTESPADLIFSQRPVAIEVLPSSLVSHCTSRKMSAVPCLKPNECWGYQRTSGDKNWIGTACTEASKYFTSARTYMGAVDGSHPTS